MIEVTLRLGWEADTLSHDGWQYDANEDGTFTLPREVYFDLRSRGLAMEYLSEEGELEDGEAEAYTAPSLPDPLANPPQFADSPDPVVLGASPAEVRAEEVAANQTEDDSSPDEPPSDAGAESEGGEADSSVTPPSDPPVESESPADTKTEKPPKAAK